MQLKIQKAHQNAVVPKYTTSGAAGFDLYGCNNLSLRPGERGLVSTGLIFDIPEGYELQIRPRSGLALKSGLTVLNSPGTIDSDYKGVVMVILINHSYYDVTVNEGERIAQGVIAAVTPQVVFEEVLEVTTVTDRGSNGFGSTGTK